MCYDKRSETTDGTRTVITLSVPHLHTIVVSEMSLCVHVPYTVWIYFWFSNPTVSSRNNNRSRSKFDKFFDGREIVYKRRKKTTLTPTRNDRFTRINLNTFSFGRPVYNATFFFTIRFDTSFGARSRLTILGGLVEKRTIATRHGYCFTMFYTSSRVKYHVLCIRYDDTIYSPIRSDTPRATGANLQ